MKKFKNMKENEVKNKDENFQFFIYAIIKINFISEESSIIADFKNTIRLLFKK